MNSTVQLEVSALLLLGVSGMLLFFSYALLTVAVLLFIIAIALILLVFYRGLYRAFLWSRGEKLLLGVTGLFALSHAVGLFLPEVGFDAVWYHLPITQVYLHLHALVFIPKLYQSAMPQLGSLLFVIPYLALGTFGVKIFCYVMTILLVMIFFQSARFILPQKIALLTSLIFFSFHTVAWQASSAYVDQIIAVYELLALLLLLRSPKRVVATAILLGLALSMKLLTLLFLPAFLLCAFLSLGAKKTILLAVIVLLVAAPWYIHAYFLTGNPVFPLFQSLSALTILRDNGVSGWWQWATSGLIKFIFLPIYLSLHRESFTTPLFAFSTPFLLIARKQLFTKKLRALTFSTLLGLALWFVTPPLSVRYALVWFAIGLILAIFAIWRVVRAWQRLKITFYAVCAASLLMSFALRLGANVAALPYLLGRESQSAYLAKNSQGIASGPMTLWYSGYWARWTPNENSSLKQ
jgi:hypothetical protein